MLPLGLLGLGLGCLIFRYWAAIKAFDVWAFDEWGRMRLGTIGVRVWHAPYHAAEHFCDPQIVRARNKAASEMNSIMMEIIKGSDNAAERYNAISSIQYKPTSHGL